VDAVALAQRGAAVPARLAPAPRKIETDYPSLGECSGFKKTSNKICTLGDTSGDKTVALLGNSHAGQWVPTLDAVAKQAGWRMVPFVKEACNFPAFKNHDSGCTTWYNWALDRIAERHPDVIVLAGETYADGWAESMQQSVADLRELAPQVVYLRLTPGLKQEPTSCLFRRGATLRSCLFRQPADADSLQEIPAAQAAGARTIDTRGWFCSGDLCPTVVGSVVTYSDDKHISATYARRLIPAFAEQMAPFLTPDLTTGATAQP
jgi:hypothetical protein